MENTETQTWLEFATECKYITETHYNQLQIRSEKVGKILGLMIRNPKNFS